MMMDVDAGGGSDFEALDDSDAPPRPKKKAAAPKKTAAAAKKAPVRGRGKKAAVRVVSFPQSFMPDSTSFGVGPLGRRG